MLEKKNYSMIRNYLGSMLGQEATKMKKEGHVNESVPPSHLQESSPGGSIPCRKRKLLQTEIHLLARILKFNKLIETLHFKSTKILTRDVRNVASFGANSFHSGIKIVYRHFQFFIFTLLNIQNGL